MPSKRVLFLKMFDDFIRVLGNSFAFNNLTLKLFQNLSPTLFIYVMCSATYQNHALARCVMYSSILQYAKSTWGVFQ